MVFASFKVIIFQDHLSRFQLQQLTKIMGMTMMASIGQNFTKNLMKKKTNSPIRTINAHTNSNRIIQKDTDLFSNQFPNNSQYNLLSTSEHTVRFIKRFLNNSQLNPRSILGLTDKFNKQFLNNKKYFQHPKRSTIMNPNTMTTREKPTVLA